MPTSGAGVRLARPDDGERLDRIVREVHGAAAWSEFGLDAAAVLADEVNHRVYLATSSGRVVGCVIASTPGFTMLHTLSVLAPHRGRNHATSMIRAAIEDARAGWATQGMAATVSESDRSGRERFARLGFRQLPNYVRKGLIALALPQVHEHAQVAAPRERTASA